MAEREASTGIEARLLAQEGVISVRAGRLHPLSHRLRQVPSHDFH